MVNKSIIIGVLAILIATASIIVMLSGSNLQIKVEKTQSTFYSFLNNSWVVSGIEHNYLYNGTNKLSAVSSSGITISSFNDSKTFTIVRTTPYTNGQKIIDTYVFSSTASKELFPVSHEINIQNAKGLTYQYSVSNLVYNGVTQTNINSPQLFGNNMKVEWQDGNFYSKLTNSKNIGTLDIKYNVPSNNEIFMIRLFDPASSINITLNSPTNATITNNYTIIFNATMSTDGSLANSSLYLNGVVNQTVSY